MQAGGRTSEWAAGLYGAVAGLAAVLGVSGGADGTVVDASWMEAMTLCTNLFAAPMWSIIRALMGIEPPGDPRSVETPSIYPSADGWIGFNTNGPQHAEAFLRLIERDDLIEAGYVNAYVRTGNPGFHLAVSLRLGPQALPRGRLSSRAGKAGGCSPEIHRPQLRTWRRRHNHELGDRQQGS